MTQNISNSMRFTFILILLFALSSCQVRYLKADKKMVTHIPTVNNNVCKKLKDDVVLYAIFVDSEFTNIWTEYDINSTLDSINKAIVWIEDQALKDSIPLRIRFDYHQNESTVPIKGNLPRRTLGNTLLSTSGIRNLDRWADKITKEALRSFGPDNSQRTKTKIVPKNREKLLARLRDIHKTDNVALLFFINNFFTDDISVVLHSFDDDSPEYGIVSYKNPGVIAHEFLHLFGALDLYLSPFDKGRGVRKKKIFAMKEFPNEIMAFPHRRMSVLEISSFSKYLIGWDNELDENYKNMLIGKKFRIAKY